MTMKKERQKLAKAIRKELGKVLSYPECFSLARAYLNSAIEMWAEKRGFAWEQIIHCECCGPVGKEINIRGQKIFISNWGKKFSIVS